MRSSSHWSLGIALAAIVVVWVAAASQWILTDTVVPWDAKNQFYAFFRFLAWSIHAGSTPFWNPFHYGGHPSVADPQSLIFAPAFVAWALFDAAPSMRTFDLIVYAHLLFGGLALGVLGWRAGWPVPAVVLGAAVFMLGGPASGRLQHTSMILSYCLLPPAMLLLSLALQRRSIAIAAVVGMMAAVLALGRNHESLLSCIVLGAVLAAEIVSAADRAQWLRERKAVFATMAAVAILLLIPPLLLTMQFAALSNRPEVQLDRALEASLYPANLASMAVANVLGSLESTQTYWGPNFDTLPEVGATDRSFNYLFVGITTVCVLLWFGIAGGGLMRRGRRLLTGVLVAALLYTLGRYTPLYALAFDYVPGINLFRRPVDGAFVFVAALAILVGHLLADYVREGLPRPSPWRTAAVAGGALALVGWAVAFSAKSDHAWDSLRQVMKAAPIALMVIAALWLARSARARVAAAALTATMAAGELIWWNAASSLNAEPPGYYSSLEHPTGEEARALALLEREIETRRAQGERPRVEVVGVSGPWQNLAMTRGLEATNGYNPLRIGWYDRLVSPGETTHTVDQRLFPASFDGYDCALARELGLEYVVLGRPIEQVPHLARRPVADILLAGPKVWIYRLTDPEPRVRLISRVMVANVDAEVQAGRFRVNPASETALIDNGTAPSRSYLPAIGNREGNYAQIVSWRPDRVEIEVDSVQPGVLVLHEAYYPGWLVEVDGQPARLLRANVLFRGVEVSEGRHNVVFRFAPFSLANLSDAMLGLLHRRR
ncbi:MAG: YfhO family protein [Hyphomonadaceae bacterium]|nr:YfhO family protein [Hyphomonadaceae bacterium]